MGSTTRSSPALIPARVCPAGAPILRTSPNASASPFLGPGHCALLGAPGASRALMFYHAWLRDRRGKRREAAGRLLMADVVSYGSGPNRWPSVGSRGVPSVRGGRFAGRAWEALVWPKNRTRRTAAAGAAPAHASSRHHGWRSSAPVVGLRGRRSRASYSRESTPTRF
jgi:hypothetical protein